MRKVTVYFVLAIVALFSISIVMNLAYGLKDVDMTGFVAFDAIDNVDFNGEICTDSDNGRAYVKGETAVFNDMVEDYCLDDVRLVEYSCDSLFRTSEIVICPYGCQFGACV